LAPNNSFKPNLLHSGKSVAEKACHAFTSTTQVGLIQALASMHISLKALNWIAIAFFAVVALMFQANNPLFAIVNLAPFAVALFAARADSSATVALVAIVLNGIWIFLAVLLITGAWKTLAPLLLVSCALAVAVPCAFNIRALG
jgi:hypothetical protein